MKPESELRAPAKLLCTATTVVIVGLWMPVRADAHIYCGTASIPRPLERNSTIRLRDASVELEPGSSEEGSQVEGRAVYEFTNASDESVELTLGIPTPVEGRDCSFGGFKRQDVQVDGESLDLDETDITAEHPWEERHETVHLFDVEFPADEARTVVHEFVQAASGSGIVSGERILFGSSTGSAWKNTIEQVTIEIRLDRNPWYFSYDAGLSAWGTPPLKLASSTESIEDGERQTRLSFRATDWEPGIDFATHVPSNVHFGADSPHGVMEQCPAQYEVDSALEAEQNGDPEKVDSLVSTSARELSFQTLRRCRNALYARHGYDFDDEQLERHFYGDSDSNDGGATLGIRRVWESYRKNPKFSSDLLYSWEHDYAEFIKRVEKHKRKHDDSSSENNDDGEGE